MAVVVALSLLGRAVPAAENAAPVAKEAVAKKSIAKRLAMLVPHLALDYFFKVEPTVLAADGVGVYPVNFSHYFHAVDLLSYASAGMTASVPSISTRMLSTVSAAARVAVGVRTRVDHRALLAVEIGYEPVSSHTPGQSGGDGFDVSLRMEWR